MEYAERAGRDVTTKQQVPAHERARHLYGIYTAAVARAAPKRKLDAVTNCKKAVS